MSEVLKCDSVGQIIHRMPIMTVKLSLNCKMINDVPDNEVELIVSKGDYKPVVLFDFRNEMYRVDRNGQAWRGFSDFDFSQFTTVIGSVWSKKPTYLEYFRVQRIVAPGVMFARLNRDLIDGMSNIRFYVDYRTIPLLCGVNPSIWQAALTIPDWFIFCEWFEDLTENTFDPIKQADYRCGLSILQTVFK